MITFSKKSQKNQQKTLRYDFFSPPPKGNTVVCIAKKVNSDKNKLKLLKRGDDTANETLIDEYSEEIERDEFAFAISREKFCADFIIHVDPNCSPAYKRYQAETEDGTEPLIGCTYISEFNSWKASYNYQDQTILGYKINEDGTIGFPDQNKKIRGLGTSAVLLELLGKKDRGKKNWGLVEGSQHLQVTLIDFGYCLTEMQFSKDKFNHYSNPFDIVKAVFEQYNQSNEPPLPIPFFQSLSIKCEIFETIRCLHDLPFEFIQKLADENFEQFPKYKTDILQDLKNGIEYLYNQFEHNPEYIAINYINEIFENIGVPFPLSDFDNKSISHFLQMYGFLKPRANLVREESFINHIRSVFKIEEEDPGLMYDIK